MRIARYLFLIFLTITVTAAYCQRFQNLQAYEVRVDSVVPTVTRSFPLHGNWRDSVYTAQILYPEYIEMPEGDVKRYLEIIKKQREQDLPIPSVQQTTATVQLPTAPAFSSNGVPTPLKASVQPSLPPIHQHLVYSQKQPHLLCSFTPIVFKDGKYHYLASFLMKVTAKEKHTAAQPLSTRAEEQVERYAAHSILSEGRWAKIRVSETGICELTADVIRKAGFTDLSKVHLYGYGGNLVPETLTPEYLMEFDDLKPVETAIVNGKRLFYAKGPVEYAGITRIRNPYSNYGYYFITQATEPQDTISPEALTRKWKEDNVRYYTLYEKDNYAWMNGGRNLVESTTTAVGNERKVMVESPAHAILNKGGTLTVTLTAGTGSSYEISLGDSLLGSGSLSLRDYDKATFQTRTYNLKTLSATNEIRIKCTSGGPLRLDFILITSKETDDSIDIEKIQPAQAEYVYNITNQDHHADTAVDLTILIPTSQHFLEQATRLKEHHERHDGLTVRIVPADELYNEFSSGTPDVSAYKRYMKMMYDRAERDGKAPKYLLLFGDCMWDNRLLTSDCRTLNPDNLLLCYESENSQNEVESFVSDDFIGFLDDNEALRNNLLYLGIPDIGIGRFTVYSVADAKNVVDKTINYAENKNVGAWQNVLMFMGDDGNNNLHMTDANDIADHLKEQFPGFNIKKVMWDAYKRMETSTGHRYPECEQIIKSQQSQGALIMDYSGHGARNSISHEIVLQLSDFSSFKNQNLPLWITASCYVGPFDGTEDTIGETVLTNPNGGGIAFYGTTRTVYANYNKHINSAFLDAVLSTTDGKRTTLGDANRKAKEVLVTSGMDRTVNKLQYSLLGDPALALHVPLQECHVDSINGIDLNDRSATTPQVRANGKVRVSGYVGTKEAIDTSFNGLVSILVKDSEEEINCFDNSLEAEKPFVFKDRTKTLFAGVDSVRNGRFEINFVAPKDINYSGKSGMITLFAYCQQTQQTAHGMEERFSVGGSEEVFNDSIGPSVFCYLNSYSFKNGGDVNSKPYFFAEITDRDGINASGAGIGHDLQLVIDNDVDKTFTVNESFTYDFGTYASGKVSYQLPELEPGAHSLRFRVWDVMNNPSTTTLSFNVVKGLTPELIDVSFVRNSTGMGTFVVSHNRPGEDVVIDVEIFDTAGRLLHSIPSTEVSGNTTTLLWDGTTSTGKKLSTGIYLYRVNVSCEGSKKASKSKKMVLITD